MIPQNSTETERPAWKIALNQAIRDPKVLLARLGIDIPHISKPDFAVLVPESYLARIIPEDPNDPLLRQIFPFEEEAAIVPGFTRDPLEEDKTNPVPGLLHKFEGRVLLTISGACAGNCRYCFRRHYPYSTQTGRPHWPAALAYIANNSDISEVILSGGDPLSLSDDILDTLIGEIEKIPHVKILRFHTRFPVFIPSRITSALVDRLTYGRLNIAMVIHCNHANEINLELYEALQLLRRKKITLLNQSVLLKGVNDTVQSLENLSYALFDAGVLPYYLHVLDHVQGAHHFEVAITETRILEVALRARLPGYLFPRFVKEVPGMPNKVPLSDL